MEEVCREEKPIFGSLMHSAVKRDHMQICHDGKAELERMDDVCE